jgi:hypothetical protein
MQGRAEKPMPTTDQKLALALRDRLEALGLRKRAGSIYTIELAPDTLGWLGLSATRRDGVPCVNPTVGVRFQDLARLVSELCGERVHPYSGWLLSIPLYELSSPERYRDWRIAADGSEDDADDLVT